MSPDILAPGGKVKSLLLGLIFILAVATLIVYSPSLNQPPLFDESYYLAWLSHCLKTGLTSNDTAAYLGAAAADPRDGLTVLGAAYVLVTAMFTGTAYNTIRFLQVLLHLVNALLLFACVYGAMRVQRQDAAKAAGDDRDSEAVQFLHIRAFAMAAVAALYFCLFPLAPEAVAWLFGLPIELGTGFMLAATGLLLWQDQDLIKNKRVLLTTATILGMLAPWLSLKGAALVIFPVMLMLVAHGVSALVKVQILRPLLLSLALMLVSSVPAELMCLANEKALPETIKQLTIDKISLTGNDSKSEFFESGAGANIQAMVLPVNRNIDEKYNKVLRLLYLFLPLPVILFLAAALTNTRFRTLALAAFLAVSVGAVAIAASVNGQSFYGVRWLYPVLPMVCLVWAMLCLSPLFIEVGSRQSSSTESAEKVIKISLCVIFIFALSIFFFQRTFRQNLSYKSNGKLWKVIQESIMIGGQKETSPFIIVRNLPQSLSIAPILSPFSPQLLDTQTGLPRTASLSAGRLKDGLRAGKYTRLTLHYEKTFNGFIGTDLEIVNEPFGPDLDAQKIANKVSPPMFYYNGAIKLDDKKETLLLESHTRVGPALRMLCYGLSPIDGDFLYIDAKINTPLPESAHGVAALELHWLTNWQGDWEARDRKVVTYGPISDGQYHRYYFPLRTLAWTTSGLPTHLMFGFPGGASVSLKAMGLCKEAVPLPQISVAAVHKQDSNRNYFSHYCFNYPDVEELGLCAAYGRDNALDINFDVSKIEGAKGAILEFVPLSEGFRNENSSQALPVSMQIPSREIKGNIKVQAEQLGGGGLFSVRVFACGPDQKILGHASDSLKCLLDPNL